MHRVAIVGGKRTPFVKAGGAFSSLSNLELSLHSVTECVKSVGLDTGLIDELWFSTVLLDPRIPNLAREIVLRSELQNSLSAHFISNNCISGLVAASCGANRIATGQIKVALVGGSESMSRPSLSWLPAAEDFFLSLLRARSFGQKAAVLGKVRPHFFLPVPPSPKEPSTGLTMGQHCELTAKEFKISRDEQDRLAFMSHQRAAKAQGEGFFADQIAALKGVSQDGLVRPQTTVEKLSTLKPVFDRSERGTLTAGNSSALTDGASCVCLMEEGAAQIYGKEVLATIVDMEFAAVSPEEGLLMAPGIAVPKLLERRGLSFDDIDLFEVHEAFSAQVLANIKVWRDGWNAYPNISLRGEIPEEKLNVCGGSLALGHPFAATGGRLLLSLAQLLAQRNLKRGLISVCAAGAMAAAVLLERD
jgi:acetyl-CoA acetyltransferase family protein